MKITLSYVKRLKNSIFKILPLFEEGNDGLTQYLDSLIYELCGLHNMLENDKSSTLLSVIAILEHFYDDSLSANVDINLIRREVLHCLDIIDKTFVGENE